MTRTILFDADGVLTLPEEVFSTVYTRSRGLDIAPFNQFFTNEWPAFVTGKHDLKQHITDHPELWQWPGTPDGLLDYWCKAEDVRNDELLTAIRTLRQSGTRCYVATEQETYRATYMQTVMFAEQFDGFFATCDIGLRKTDPAFFTTILQQLGITQPETVLFFDDSQSKVDTARSVGIDARLYTNISQITSLLN